MRFTNKHFITNRVNRFVSFICVLSLMMLSLFCPVAAVEYERNQSKISTALLQQLSSIDKTETIPVAVWLNDIEYDENAINAQANATVDVIKSTITNEKTTLNQDNNFSFLLSSGDNPEELNDTQLFLEAKRKIFFDLYTQSNTTRVETQLTADTTIDAAQVTWVSHFSPVIKMNLTKTQIISLSQHNDVEEILLDNRSIFPQGIDDDIFSDDVVPKSDNPTQVTTPYEVWQETTNITYVKSLGYDGSGVKVGLCDGGKLDYPNLDANKRRIFDTLYREGRLIADPSAYVNDPGHAISCGGVIAATDGSVPGIAPGVTLYSTAGHNRTGGDYGAIEWLISSGCRIISISAGGAETNTYEAFSKWIDHIAIQHDVTVVFSSGNGGSIGICDGAMSYNSITVGASDDRNTVSRIDDIHAPFSSYYSGSSTSLPIKPDLVAPGASIEIPGVNGSVASGIVSGGTSISCPIVAGVIALMYEMRPSLEAKQALTKAILLAGISRCGSLTRNSVAGSTITAMQTKTGAGLVDAKAMRYIAENGRFAAGTMGSGVSAHTTTFNVSSTDTYTRVCLAWLKNNRISNSHITNSPSNPACALLYLKVQAPDGTVYETVL